VREAIFEDRIEGLAELRKLGAKIDILDAHRAAIHGPARLHGGEATIGDLRAGATLILAALAADGSSLIHGAHHVQRGYENIDRKFQQLGASIVRSADPA
jgi:UDP-N-acetylglucosamine 1-carboxyvinyltransferase